MGVGRRVRMGEGGPNGSEWAWRGGGVALMLYEREAK